MTPFLKFMNTEQLVNAFKKRSLQMAQKCTQFVFTLFTWREVVFASKTEQDRPVLPVLNQNPTFTYFLQLETEEKIIPFILSYFGIQAFFHIHLQIFSWNILLFVMHRWYCTASFEWKLILWPADGGPCEDKCTGSALTPRFMKKIKIQVLTSIKLLDQLFSP